MKYQGKYKAYIGFKVHNDIHKAEYIQLGTFTGKTAQKMRKAWHEMGFDWIMWRKPTKEEIELAKILEITDLHKRRDMDI